MGIDILLSSGGSPSYPYRKVVLLGDYAEVAELTCQGPEGENIVYHADLFERLLRRHPELDGAAMFTPAWLCRNDTDVVLYVSAGEELGAQVAERIGAALHDWCADAGIRRLTITDTSRRSGNEDSSADDWSLPL